MRAVGQALWHRRVGHVNPPVRLRPWLVGTESLTAKLVACSRQFRVRRLCQRRAPCLADEFALLGLARRMQVRQREVLLECDGVPIVYAHTVVPLSATAHDWPFFGGLGERSLGTTLFGDPRVVRGHLQYARLGARHPLVRRARAAAGVDGDGLFARRCLYRRRKGLLLVTELFLPAVAALPARATVQPLERLSVR